ncbi:cell wall metabolism sensor histidine kinase WalK [Chengkuizengella sediminis]|uniref:cell wall metabolism sensor histidine kinase WalK n=1 Tax=Chengkuizengella sediminis TaxID=1885917 RepID=UPI0013894251|nr:cell wall metabolism sensor histidine kinase WalK [Chengkuizengella sediminis]NDI36920.1 cell wall metabolism sensor histidine kinase WalK [Chengkuizengella sediminis]
MKGTRFFQTIQVKLIIIYVLLILIAMQLIGIYFIRTMENSFINNFTDSLNNQVELLSNFVQNYLEPSNDDTGLNEEDLHSFVENLSTLSGSQIQVISADAIVMSSSNQPDKVGQKITQPAEIIRSINGIQVPLWDVKDSSNIRKKAIAKPVKNDDNKVIGAIYIVASTEELFKTINNIKQIFIAGTIIALVLTIMLSIVLSNTITHPIKMITKKAKALAEGKYNQEVVIRSSDEIGQLGYAFNHMVQRLKDALYSNEEEKNKIASILLNMSDGVIATDDKGKVIVINLRAEQMLDIHEEDVIGREIAEILGTSKEEIGRYVLGEQNSVLIELPRQDEAESLQVKVTFTPIQRRGRGVTGTIIVLQDVTEQEKLNQSRREFVANVSHELRTPLTTIKSYLEALEDGALNEANLAKRFVGVTRNEADRMIRLVSDLLHLSRYDSNQMVVMKKETEIKQMLEDVVDRFSFQLKQRNIKLILSMDQSIHTIMIDPDKLDQVLDNLISNAIKYTADEGEIEINCRRKGQDWIEISVQDNGLGIPKKDIHRIFERFYRVDKARSRNMGGTGLGLSIAKEIINAHGGEITLESELHKGTKVTFIIPTFHLEGEQQ